MNNNNAYYRYIVYSDNIKILSKFFDNQKLCLQELNTFIIQNEYQRYACRSSNYVDRIFALLLFLPEERKIIFYPGIYFRDNYSYKADIELSPIQSRKIDCFANNYIRLIYRSLNTTIQDLHDAIIEYYNGYQNLLKTRDFL